MSSFHNFVSTCFSCRPTLQQSTAAQGAEPGPASTDGGDGNGNGDGGGLSWLTNVGGSPVPTAAPIGKSSTSEDNAGNDWLAAATSSGQTKNKPPQSAAASKRGSPTPTSDSGGGGWMSSGKLGLPTGDDSDEDGENGPVAAAAKPKKGKQTGGGVSAASGPGGWLGSGGLGIPAEEESDEDDGGGGGGGGRAVMVTMETQTEDDIEEVTKNGGTRKLPPWAKPWTPPPKPEVVPDPVPEPSIEKGVRWLCRALVSRLPGGIQTLELHNSGLVVPVILNLTLHDTHLINLMPQL